MNGRTFPVLLSREQERVYPYCPRSVPFSMVAEHARQASYNHKGNTLDSLAAAGGLDPIELMAVLRDRSYPKKEVEGGGLDSLFESCVKELVTRVRDWCLNARPSVSAETGYIWQCTICNTVNSFLSAGGVKPDSRTASCSFCRVIHDLQINKPMNPSKDDSTR